jgi:hypothetical protein
MLRSSEAQWFDDLRRILGQRPEKWKTWFTAHFVDGSLDPSSLSEISILRIDHARGMVVKLISRRMETCFSAELRVFAKGDPEEVPSLRFSPVLTIAMWSGFWTYGRLGFQMEIVN